MSISVKIVKDASGFPSLVTASKSGLRLTAKYDKDSSIQVTGSKNSLADSSLWESLMLVYPFAEKPDLAIPQPLQVQQTKGKSIILYDDMESLLKWANQFGGVAIDNTFAYNGAQSLKITANAGGIEVASRWFPTTTTKGKIRCSFIYAVDDNTKLEDLTIQLLISEGTQEYNAQAFYNGVTRVWSVINNAGTIPIFTDTNLPLSVNNVSGPWHYFSMLIDLNMKTTLEIQHDTHIWQGAMAIGNQASAVEMSGYLLVSPNAIAANNVNMWLDDVLIVEEP